MVLGAIWIYGDAKGSSETMEFTGKNGGNMWWSRWVKVFWSLMATHRDGREHG